MKKYGKRSSLRLKIIDTWYAEKAYKQEFHQDLSSRSYMNESLKHARISKVIIERTINLGPVTKHSSWPGVIIGKKGLYEARNG